MASLAASRGVFLGPGSRALRRAPARGRLAPRASLRARAAADGRVSLFVKVTVKSGQLDAYKRTIEAHIVNCFANDRCMYFDYGISEDKPNVVNLYEVYEDEDALAEHKKSAHLAEYLEAAKDLVDGQSEVTEMTLALAEFGSVNCNYAGECELGEYAWGE